MVQGPRTVNSGIPPRKFTVILLNTFDFQHYSKLSATSLSIDNRINSLGISGANKTPLKRRRRLRPLK